MKPTLREYQRQVVANARALAACISKLGFRMVTGRTDKHLFLIELHSRGLTGSDAEKALDPAGITVNKNAIPFHPLPPMKAGGIRPGSPSITTRAMGDPETEQIVPWTADFLVHIGDAAVAHHLPTHV